MFVPLNHVGLPAPVATSGADTMPTFVGLGLPLASLTMANSGSDLHKSFLKYQVLLFLHTIWA